MRLFPFYADSACHELTGVEFRIGTYTHPTNLLLITARQCAFICSCAEVRA